MPARNSCQLFSWTAVFAWVWRCLSKCHASWWLSWKCRVDADTSGRTTTTTAGSSECHIPPVTVSKPQQKPEPRWISHGQTCPMIDQIIGQLESWHWRHANYLHNSSAKIVGDLRRATRDSVSRYQLVKWHNACMHYRCQMPVMYVFFF